MDTLTMADLNEHRGSSVQHKSLLCPPKLNVPSRHNEEALDALIGKIAKDRAAHAKKNKTAFFCCVMSGEVELVRKLLHELRSRGLHNDLAWVLGKSDDVEKESGDASHKVIQWLVYIACVLLFIVTSPIFYVIHGIIKHLYWGYRSQISVSPELSLVYAVLSGNPVMIQLFLDNGCKIEAQDESGNTIFHHLANISRERVPRVIRGHHALLECLQDRGDISLKKALTDIRNWQNLSALEAICLYGAPEYFNYVSEFCLAKDQSDSLLGSNILDSNERSSWDSFILDSRKRTMSTDRDVHISEYDIEMYDKRDGYGFHSYLIQLFMNRREEKMTEEEILTKNRSRLMSKWMKLKLPRYVWFSVIGNLVNVVILGLMLLQVYLHRGDSHRYPPVKSFWDHYHYLVNQSLNGIPYYEYYGDSKDRANALLERNWNKSIDSFKMNCSESCINISDEEMMELLLSDTTDVHQYVHFVYKAFVFIQFTLDLICRQSFLWHNFNFKAGTLLESVLPAMHRDIPGSYVEKQLTLMSAAIFGVIIFTEYIQSQISAEITTYEFKYKEIPPEEFDNFLYVHKIWGNFYILEDIFSILFIVCLILRILMVIHIFRLVPITNCFVVVTKKMCSDLFQIAVFFLLVLACFGIIFHFVMIDERCPLAKNKAFDTPVKSMFSTYVMILGHQYFEDIAQKPGAVIAYIICTIFLVLMLLNLVIALMTTTADSLYKSPWRESLCRREVWEEILGTEAQVHCILAPVWKYMSRPCGLDTKHTLKVLHMPEINTQSCAQPRVKSCCPVRINSEMVHFD